MHDPSVPKGPPRAPASYLDAIECKRQHDLGLTDSEVAKRTGFSVPHVQNLLLLMAGPTNLRELVSEGQISTTLAIETLRAHGSEALSLILQGLSLARVEGRQRVTNRHVQQVLRTVALKHGSGTAGRQVSRAVIKRCFSWVLDNDLAGDGGVIRLLAFLAGADRDQVALELEKQSSKVAGTHQSMQGGAE